MELEGLISGAILDVGRWRVLVVDLRYIVTDRSDGVDGRDLSNWAHDSPRRFTLAISSRQRIVGSRDVNEWIEGVDSSRLDFSRNGPGM